MMKARLFVALAALSACLAACSPDAPNTTPDPEGDGDGSAGGTGGSTNPDGGTGGTSDGGTSNGGTGPFSFFVTSLEAMRELSGSQDGFGGDLRFGEATGLAGADKICQAIAEKAEPGAAQRVWRAFLSASTGGANGGPVHAIDRIGEGPWYDRNGRLVAANKAGLLSTRPQGDAQLKNDLPNERGEPNHQGVDNHDILTGTTKQGQFIGGSMANTCNDWTSAVGSTGRPMVGHSWPRSATNLSNGGNWMSDHPAPGCAPGVNLIQNGPGDGSPTVGGGGGYGGIYCFAVTP
jgi:hypothetical protein